MRIGLSPQIPGSGSVDDVVAAARQTADDGFATYWMAQVFGLDALTALTVAGREVTGIELGTAVVPTYPRHPWVMAQQALTAQAAIGNRLALGIGLSHKIVIEGMWGMSFAKPVLHLREYLEVLVPLSKGQAVEVEGDTVTARGTIDVPGAAPFPVLVAALGPQMLELTGRLADGTITWCVGPKTLADFTIPTISAASVVTPTGNIATTRGTARPARSAAAEIVGMVKSANVFGPTHHVMVPSASRPVSSNI